MKILLVDPREKMSIHTVSEVRDITGCRAYMPNLALPTLAALATDDVEITIVDESVEPIDFDREWDLVGITGYITDKKRMFEIADEFKARGRLVAIGGPYATLSSSTVRPYADILFIGEAEHTWPQFLADFRAGHWKTEYRAFEAVDLHSSPVPDIGKLKHDAYFMGVVQTSRGCPFECEFCDVIVYLGRKQRHKEPDRIVQELEQLYRAGYRYVFLSDDNFTVNRRKAGEIMTAIREWNRSKPEKMLFATQMSIDVARDSDMPLLDLCAEAGLKMALIGIETTNQDALREVKKRQNLQRDLVGDIQRIQSKGIMVEALMMTGFDADTTESFCTQYEFAQEAGVPLVALSILSAPEGTPLEKRLMKENRMQPWALDDFFLNTNVTPKRMTNQQLLQGTRWLWNKLYAPEAFLQRIDRLAQNLPAANQTGKATPQGTLRWRRILKSYEAWGPAFKDIPPKAATLLRGKDIANLGNALIFYKHIVGVLRGWEVWDPALALLDEPDFGRELEPASLMQSSE